MDHSLELYEEIRIEFHHSLNIIDVIQYNHVTFGIYIEKGFMGL